MRRCTSIHAGQGFLLRLIALTCVVSAAAAQDRRAGVLDPRGEIHIPIGIAMPHGRAIAEVHLLLRDCLAYEDDQQLVLFAGVPASWFTDRTGMTIRNLPTQFGKLDVSWKTAGRTATLRLNGDAAPPEGFLLPLPGALKSKVSVGEREIDVTESGFVLPAGTKQVEIQFGS